MHAVIGIKKGQTQKFRTDGKRIPVTVVSVDGNTVFAIKTIEKDGYWAAQVGLGTAKNPSKPLQGHTKGANVEKAPRFLREVRFTDGDALPAVGDTISIDAVLQPGDQIDVTGVSKGKGFAGGVKRFHFRGGPRTHGQSDRERAPGSIGQTTTPGRVYKGKRMAGKMGFETVTVKNLTVADVEGNTLYIEGLIPGALGALVKVKKTGTDKRFVPLLKEEKEVPAEEATTTEEVAAEAAPVIEELKQEAAVEEAKTEAPATEEISTEQVAEEVPAEPAAEEKTEETK